MRRAASGWNTNRTGAVSGVSKGGDRRRQVFLFCISSPAFLVAILLLTIGGCVTLHGESRLVRMAADLADAREEVVAANSAIHAMSKDLDQAIARDSECKQAAARRGVGQPQQAVYETLAVAMESPPQPALPTKERWRTTPVTEEELERLMPRSLSNWTIDAARPEGRLCLRRWRMLEEEIAFIHIGKAGGTTMDSLLSKVTMGGLKENGLMRCGVGLPNHPPISSTHQLRIAMDRRFISSPQCPKCLFCGAHNDFYFINNLTDAEKEHIAPIVWVRDPAHREVSQFYFSRKIGVIEKEWPLSDWIWGMLTNTSRIRGTNSLFGDGSSGVMWFSGLTPDGWVNAAMSKEERARVTPMMRQLLMEDRTRVLRVAVENFHRSLWVGILEDWGASMDLLGHQADWHFTSRPNPANSNKHEEPSGAEVEMLRRAYPMDAAFYAYAKYINDQRLNLFRKAREAGSLEPAACHSLEEWAEYRVPFYFEGTRIN